MTTDNESPEDFWGWLDDDALEIPGVKSTKYPEGKAYSIPSPDAETGMRLTALAELAAKKAKGIEIKEADVKRLNLNDTEEREFAEQVLGAALAEMQGDGVSWVRIQRITKYAFTHFAVSAESAREAASRGVFEGKAQARPNRAARRAKPTTQKAPPASGATRSPRKAPRADG